MLYNRKITDGRFKKNPVEPHRDLLSHIWMHYSAGLEVVVEIFPQFRRVLQYAFNLIIYFLPPINPPILLPMIWRRSTALSTWAPEDLTGRLTINML